MLLLRHIQFLPALLKLMIPVSAIVFSAGRVSASPGELDPSFGVGGLVALAVNAQPYLVLAQPDGKIISFGAYPYGDWAYIARTWPNGTADLTFGVNGLLLVNLNESLDSYKDVALLDNGKYLVLGTYNDRAALFRLNPNGSPDLLFGEAGILTANFKSVGDALAIQPDGKLLVAGSGENGVFIVRINADGSLDNSFGLNGIAVSATDNVVNKLWLQRDGKILTLSGDSKIMRFTQDGTQDLTFGTMGMLTNVVGRWTVDVAVMADKIVVSSLDSYSAYIQRFLNDGRLDPSFTTITIPLTVNPYSFGPATSIAIQPDGKILIGGDRYVYCSIARFLENGSVDTSFGASGVVTSPPGRFCRFYDISLQPDGKILATGDADGVHGVYPVVIRYLGDE